MTMTRRLVQLADDAFSSGKPRVRAWPLTAAGDQPAMETALFDFELPPALIAQHPVEPRDAARLLAVGPGLSDHRVSDLPSLLRPSDLLVFNDTKVLPSRLLGRRGEAKVEVTLHKAEGPVAESPTRWRAFARPAKRLREGDEIRFDEDLRAQVAAKGEAGEVTLAFDRCGAALAEALERLGVMPLPPYIKRAPEGDRRDRTDYQTLFARHPGAVAAPTAGLHFTPDLMAALQARGVATAFVTLHVGAGTFLPVKTERAEAHRMHAETAILPEETVAAVEAARRAGGRVIAVGSTALRTLEAHADESGALQAGEAEVDLFILPGYRFKAVDLLITNFHLPRSTLFMLVAAFAGLARMQAAYAHAIASGYRFYSYGDCCLLEREA